MSESGGRYDRSFADLMAGVAVVFLLLAVIFIQKADRERKSAIDDRNRSAEKVAAEKELVQSSLVQLHGRLTSLNDAMGGRFLELIDGGVNDLEIEFKDLQFALGRCRTPPSYEDQLRDGGVRLVREICTAVDAIRAGGASATIILEGHTDNRPFALRSSECGVFAVNDQSSFENNVRASAARAQEVFFTIRDTLPDAGYERRCLDDNFVVSGRGEAAPRPGVDPGDEHNRRLVIRVRGDLRLQ
jgi:hypothetical protein